ncbi:hypothetical protein [Nocardioides sp. KR10-350]|uniref:hypothetical protein n=1 Tax=Nocardioides cheoyonin TaxID=3156615 RepID=UPI0032B3E8CF
MVTYFTARTDADALDARATPPEGLETIRTSLAPDDPAFTLLIELIYGEERSDAEAKRIAPVPSVEGDGLTRIGSVLRDRVAAMDERTLQDLAAPWSSSATRRLEGLDVDAEAFLTDFQHLCRHARATDADVYAADFL